MIFIQKGDVSLKNQRSYNKETLPDIFDFKVSSNYLNGMKENRIFSALRVSEDSFAIMWLDDEKKKQLIHYHINHVLDYLLNYDWLIVD